MIRRVWSVACRKRASKLRQGGHLCTYVSWASHSHSIHHNYYQHQLAKDDDHLDQTSIQPTRICPLRSSTFTNNYQQLLWMFYKLPKPMTIHKEKHMKLQHITVKEWFTCVRTCNKRLIGYFYRTADSWVIWCKPESNLWQHFNFCMYYLYSGMNMMPKCVSDKKLLYRKSPNKLKSRLECLNK